MAGTDTIGLLKALGSRYGLTEPQIARLTGVLRALELDDLAPTTVRAPSLALDVHLGDSLVALALERVRVARRIVDIGSGAGFPGLPLAVALPESRVELIDSQSRKCAFVERVKAAAGVDNAETVCARVEEWPEGLGAHDLALARAVAPQPVVLEYAAPLLQVGGALVDWRGRRNPAEERAAETAAEVLGLSRLAIQRVQPFDGAREHHLHVYRKEKETPERFPRRSGMARKRPLAT